MNTASLQLEELRSQLKSQNQVWQALQSTIAELPSEALQRLPGDALEEIDDIIASTMRMSPVDNHYTNSIRV